MRLSDFDYELPDELIAQAPAERREDARLLVEPLEGGPRAHRSIADLPELLDPGDLLVVNDTRVRRARLWARRASGGRVECLLVERLPGTASRWSALCRPAAKLRAGEVLEVDGGAARIVPLERGRDARGEPSPTWVVELTGADGAPPADEEALVEAIGDVPLPPYVRRAHGPDDRDAERYQTVYARELGAVAAPTAGLHLSEALLARLAERGVERTEVTLHVGPGTFRPVDAEDPREHPMHTERYRVTEAARAAIAAARARGGRVVAVGTTVVRTLVAADDGCGLPRVGSGATDLFLHPGSAEAERLAGLGGVLTNFHLPRSTLLMLVAALAGTERTLELYRDAVERRYRFYSYGDACLFLRARPGAAR